MNEYKGSIHSFGIIWILSKNRNDNQFNFGNFGKFRNIWETLSSEGAAGAEAVAGEKNCGLDGGYIIRILNENETESHHLSIRGGIQHDSVA